MQDKDREAIQLIEVVSYIDMNEVQRINLLPSRKHATHLLLIPFVAWNTYDL